jgi:(5-formylfuran-3-yl)methyl phosphate synthase
VLARAAAIRKEHAPDRPLSAALGPAVDGGTAALAAEAALLGFDFLKTGLEGAPDARTATALLTPIAGAARRVFPAVRLIAAGYADAPGAGSIDPSELPAIAAAAGFDGCLVDTAAKDGRGILHHLGRAGVASFVRACHSRGLLAAVAGSIDAAGLAEVVGTGPDVIGARGALCSGGRRGRLDPERVRVLRVAISAAARMRRAIG